MIDTESIYLLDECSRRLAWNWAEPPRTSLAAALNDALRVGLLSGSPESARDHLMERAANPGFNLSTTSLYDTAIHHAALIEVITAYLLGKDGPWKPADPTTLANHPYTPLSYQMPDGRLRRVILCSKWDDLRAKEEATSWRTVADICTLAQPMLLNAISIGSMAKGFRPSVWTKCWEHPVSRIQRVRPIVAEKFNDRWQTFYRERTNQSPANWLLMMQNDQAFEGVVNSLEVAIPPDAASTLRQMEKMAGEINQLGVDGEMRRSSCYKIIPCVFSPLCHSPERLTPISAMWPSRQGAQKESSLSR